MPRILHTLPQTSEVNCVPLSEVTEAETLKQAFHLEKRASAQLLAEVDKTGMASAQRIDLATTMKRCVSPASEVGRGTARSMWTWEKRPTGTSMGFTTISECTVTLLQT